MYKRAGRYMAHLADVGSPIASASESDANGRKRPRRSERKFIPPELKVGSHHHGSATSEVSGGVLIKFNRGLVGFLSRGKMTADLARSPFKKLKKKELFVFVERIDRSKRKIALTMRPDHPHVLWTLLAEELAKRETIHGIVAAHLHCGVLIDVFPGITGLLYIPAHSVPRSETEARFPIGSRLHCRVASVDNEMRRIAIELAGKETTWPDPTRGTHTLLTECLANCSRQG